MFFTSGSLFESPLIPAEFTAEELEVCKKTAKEMFIKANPHLATEEARQKLDIMNQMRAVEYLNALFENAVKQLKAQKETV